MLSKVQNKALTALVQFGFDVLVCSITDKDMIIAIDTNDPVWVKAKVAELCDTCNAAYTLYTDLDRVHGYIYN